MNYQYYPGCTLQTTAKNLEKSLLAIANALGFTLTEMSDWVCCGAVSPLATDNDMKLLAPIRNLAKADNITKTLVTSCVFCYNILKRTNKVLNDDKARHQKINDFLEESYSGQVQVRHILEVLRDDVGYHSLRTKRKRKIPLTVAPFYGCMLLRPPEILQIDNAENPSLLKDLFESVGCRVIDYPYRTECCGSYVTLKSQPIALDRTKTLVTAARIRGADVIVCCCPLCFFNLDYFQKIIQRSNSQFVPIPVLYFSQVLSIAFDVCESSWFSPHHIDPRPMLFSTGCLTEEGQR
jgi:heterodisulfide reductase subunit B